MERSFDRPFRLICGEDEMFETRTSERVEGDWDDEEK
jgi:hypothetical protein